VKPVKLPDGRVTVPEEVIESMKRNKIGLKGESPMATVEANTADKFVLVAHPLSQREISRHQTFV